VNKTPDQSVTDICLMTPKPDEAARLRASLAALVQPTRTEPGCLAYDLYEEPNGLIVLVETWGSEAELAAHQQQPAVRDLFGDRLGDLLTEEMTVHYARRLTPPA
jgi:quinol monooxygenase YgiN